MRYRPPAPLLAVRPLRNRKSIAILGPLKYSDEEHIKDVLDDKLEFLIDPIIETIVAPGVCSVASSWAQWNWYLLRLHRPDRPEVKGVPGLLQAVSNLIDSRCHGVLLFTSKTCVFSARALDMVQRKGIKYKELPL